MVFTMAELRHELHALGYGAVPDDFIVSSLSQLQLDVPRPSGNKVEKVGDRDGSTSSSRRVRFAGKPSQQVHGRPVPGDREFAMSRKPTFRKGGLDSICFTPDFATELDEMRKMMKVMQGTKEEMFGSGSGASSQRPIRQPMGLADEHEIYVGNLMDKWRVVGRSIRSKRKESLPVDVGAPVINCSNGSAPSSETGTQKKLEQNERASGVSENGTGHRQMQHEAFLDRVIQPLAEPSSSGELKRRDEGCDLQAEGVTVAERNEGNRSAEDELSPSSSSSFVGTAGEGIIENEPNEEVMNARHANGIRSGIGGLVGVKGIDTGPVFTRQVSSSAISPGVSYQQGGMLYPENFTADTYQQPELIMSEEIPLSSHQDTDDNLLPSHQDAEDNSFLSSPRSSMAQLTKDQMLDKLSAMSQDQFLAAFQKSLDDLYPKDVIDQEKFAQVNQKISDAIKNSHLSVRHHVAQQPLESENPLDLGVPVLVRTPDRRGNSGGRHQSPLNDRSNMRIAEGQMVKKAELHSAKVLKRSSTVMLQRSRSSRVVSRRNEIVEEPNDKHPLDNVKGGSQVDSHLTDNKTTPPSSARKLKSERVLSHSKSVALSRRRNEIAEETNDTHLSDYVEGRSQVDSHLLVENATTPPSSARKLKSERLHRLTKSAEKSSSSPRYSFRHNRTGSALDGSDLDIPSLGLSPVKVREQPASALNNPSTRERSCVANGLSEHRPGTHCSACYPPSSTAPKSSENNSQSSASPFGKNTSEATLSDTEASPQQKRSVTKETGAGSGSLSKQKLASTKSASVVPSGIYTPSLDPKKNDLNSNLKAVLKPRRLGSSMDFVSDTSRITERRTPSLRSSTESSRSSGPQRAPSAQSQLSKSNSISPYAKSSFSSRSATPNATSKDMLSSPFGKTPSFTSYGSRSSATTKETLTPGGPRRGGKVDRVARFAEMQNLWKNDKFLKTSSKRKPQSFHRIFARLHLSHERCTAAYRERVIEDMRPSTEPPPFVVPTALYNNSEGVCSF